MFTLQSFSPERAVFIQVFTRGTRVTETKVVLEGTGFETDAENDLVTGTITGAVFGYSVTTELGTNTVEFARWINANYAVESFVSEQKSLPSKIYATAMAEGFVLAWKHDLVASDMYPIIHDFTAHDSLSVSPENGTLAAYETKVLKGLGGDDVLFSYGAQSTISGGRGDDLLAFHQDGQGLLQGNRGDDTLTGAIGDDTLQGGRGNDRLDGDAGHDRLDGHQGNDTLNGEAGNDTLFGGKGDDVLYGGSGADALYGGDGNDILDGWSRTQSGPDTLHGGNGRDVLWTGENQTAELTGGRGADLFGFWTFLAAGSGWSGPGERQITVTDFDARIDRLWVGWSDKEFHSPISSARIFQEHAVQEGNDVVFDNGYLKITFQNTALESFTRDLFLAGWWRQTWNGTDGERVEGSREADWLEGTDFDDLMLGFSGADTLWGDFGDDTLVGMWGDDTLRGGFGDDRLWGGRGDDTLIADRGADRLHGGQGSDSFVFHIASDPSHYDRSEYDGHISGSDPIEYMPLTEHARVADFNLADDQLWLLRPTDYMTAAEQFDLFTASAVQAGADTLFDDGYVRILLRNVALEDLTQDHFAGHGGDISALSGIF